MKVTAVVRANRAMAELCMICPTTGTFRIMRSRKCEKAVYRIRDDVSVGYQVNMAMKQVNLFPHMVIQMVAIGEEAGALDTMLFKVAEFYEQEVNNAVDALSSLIEPLVMVVIGTMVGAIVIAMYLPIFKLAMTVG